MKIGILGSGDVAKSIATGFLMNNHEVMISSRNPSDAKVTDWVKEKDEHASGGSFVEAANYGEIIVVATAWSGTESAIKMADLKNFANKVVIDVTNPLDFSIGKPMLAIGHTDSTGERIQKMLPDAHVVKTLNIITHSNMVNPKFTTGTPTMLLCGNDKNAKEQVEKILKEFGWKDTIDIGDITGARLMEPMCILWVTLGGILGNYNHGFSVLRG
jgi:8-hydroxy-5-deazaflavin:NADPH oxidoreductase